MKRNLHGKIMHRFKNWATYKGWSTKTEHHKNDYTKLGKLVVPCHKHSTAGRLNVQLLGLVVTWPP